MYQCTSCTWRGHVELNLAAQQAATTQSERAIAASSGWCSRLASAGAVLCSSKVAESIFFFSTVHPSTRQAHDICEGALWSLHHYSNISRVVFAKSIFRVYIIHGIYLRIYILVDARHSKADAATGVDHLHIGQHHDADAKSDHASAAGRR